MSKLLDLGIALNCVDDLVNGVDDLLIGLVNAEVLIRNLGTFGELKLLNPVIELFKSGLLRLTQRYFM